MKPLADSLQRFLFTVVLYASAVSGIITDVTSESSRTALYAIYDASILLLALLSLSYVKKNLAIILLLVIGCILINLSYCPNPLFMSLNGIRGVILLIALPVFYSKVFAEGNEIETRKYIKIFRNYAWFFLLVQIPAVGWQYSKFGATDDVGGTFGAYNSGVLTLVIICLVFFMFQFKLAFWKQLLLYFLLTPLMLNETKISFILIPMMIVFIYFEPKLKNILFGLVGGLMFLFLVNKFYSNGISQGVDSENHMTDIFNPDFLNDYLLSGYEEHQDVPRVTKIILAYNMISQETNTMLFGMEYGVFRGSVAGMSAFAENYNWLLSGTRPYLFYLMIQGGLGLVVGFFLIILRINNFFRRTNKYNVFYFILMLLILFYVDPFRMQNFSMVYFFVIFFGNSAMFKNKSLEYEGVHSIG